MACFRWNPEHSRDIGIHSDMWRNTFLSRRAAAADRWSGRAYNYHVHVPLQLCQEAAGSGGTAIFGLGWMVRSTKID
jgi:hypothetical protein